MNAPIPETYKLEGIVLDDTGVTALKRAILRGSHILLSKVSFTAPLELPGVEATQSLTFRGCWFYDHVNFTNSRFRQSLIFSDCEFRRSITLRGACVDAPLHMENCIIGMAEDWHRTDIYADRPTMLFEPPPVVRSARWDGLTVHGSLNARGLTVYGSLRMGGAHIHGRLDLAGCNIGEMREVIGPDSDPIGSRLSPGRLYLRQARVERHLELGPRHHPNIRNAPVRTTIHGSLSLGGAIIRGRFSLRGALIKRCLHGIMLHVHGRVLFDAWEYPISAKDLKELFPGGLDGELKYLKERFVTTIGIEAQTNDGISLDFHDAVFEKSIWLRGIQTEGSIVFENSRIGGNLDLKCWETRFREAPAGQPGKPEHEEEYSLWEHPFITDDPVARKTDWKKVLNDNAAVQDSWIPTRIGEDEKHESLQLRNSTIGGNLEMRGVRTLGRLAFHGTIVLGNVHCNLHCLKADRRCIRPRIGSGARGKSWALYGAKIRGNLEFLGAHFEGALRLRYVRVGGAIDGRPGEERILEDEDVVKYLKYVDKNDRTGKRWHVRTEVGASEEKGHSLYLYGANIDGNVCCSDILLRGQLSMEVAHIHGRVEFKNAIINYPRERSNLPELKPAWADKKSEPPYKMPDRADDILEKGIVCLELARISSEVDFSEAKIRGQINARGLRLEGDATFRLQGVTLPDYVRQKRKEAWSTHGEEEPDLNLEGANIQHLKLHPVGRVTDDADCHSASPTQARFFIRLDHATVKKLQIEDFGPNSPWSNEHYRLDCEGFHFGHLELCEQRPTWTYTSFPKYWARGYGDLKDKGLLILYRGVRKLIYRGFSPKPFLLDYHQGPRWYPSDPSTPARYPIGIGLVFHFALGCLAVEIALGGWMESPGGQFTWVKTLFLGLPIFSLFLANWVAFGRQAYRLVWRSSNNPWVGFLASTSSVERKDPLQEVMRRFPDANDRLKRWLCYPKYWKCEMKRGACDFFGLFSPSLRGNLLAYWCKRDGTDETRRHFSSAIYLNVRNMLDREGRDEKADEVYLAMRQRQLLEEDEKPWVRFFRWIYFVAAGSGVRAGRLSGFLGLCFIFSWLAIFSNPDSVEHPSVFEPVVELPTGGTNRQVATAEGPTSETQPADSGAGGQVVTAKGPKRVLEPTAGNPDKLDKNYGATGWKRQWSVETDRGPGKTWQEVIKESQKENTASWPYQYHQKDLDENHREHVDPWGLKEGFWMAVRVHVPLLHLFAKEKWTPSSRDGYYQSLRGLRKMPFGMEYETYAVLIQIISYLTIPMLIAAISGFYKRGEIGSHNASQGNGGGHGH